MFDPSSKIQDFLVFGEFGDVNPSITDSSTFTFLTPERMEDSESAQVSASAECSRWMSEISKLPTN